MLIIIGRGASHRALCRTLEVPRYSLVDQVLYQHRGGPNPNAETPFERYWREYRPAQRDKVVLWGRSISPNHWLLRDREVLNKTIVFNKLRQLQLMENEGINVPIFFRTAEGLDEFLNETDFSWLGRRAHHARGSDITGPWTTEQMRGRLERREDNYGVQLINKTHEFRVHVFNGEVLRVARKVWTMDGDVPTNPVWNALAGWHYQYNTQLRNTTRQNLTMLARVALRALGMDFGAVDIIGKRNGGGQWEGKWVLEVNSAPGIADNVNTLEAYAGAIRRWALPNPIT